MQGSLLLSHWAQGGSCNSLVGTATTERLDFKTTGGFVDDFLVLTFIGAGGGDAASSSSSSPSESGGVTDRGRLVLAWVGRVTGCVRVGGGTVIRTFFPFPLLFTGAGDSDFSCSESPSASEAGATGGVGGRLRRDGPVAGGGTGGTAARSGTTVRIFFVWPVVIALGTTWGSSNPDSLSSSENVGGLAGAGADRLPAGRGTRRDVPAAQRLAFAVPAWALGTCTIVAGGASDVLEEGRGAAGSG